MCGDALGDARGRRGRPVRVAPTPSRWDRSAFIPRRKALRTDQGPSHRDPACGCPVRATRRVKASGTNLSGVVPSPDVVRLGHHRPGVRQGRRPRLPPGGGAERARAGLDRPVGAAHPRGADARPRAPGRARHRAGRGLPALRPHPGRGRRADGRDQRRVGGSGPRPPGGGRSGAAAPDRQQRPARRRRRRVGAPGRRGDQQRRPAGRVAGRPDPRQHRRPAVAAPRPVPQAARGRDGPARGRAGPARTPLAGDLPGAGPARGRRHPRAAGQRGRGDPAAAAAADPDVHHRQHPRDPPRSRWASSTSRARWCASAAGWRR